MSDGTQAAVIIGTVLGYALLIAAIIVPVVYLIRRAKKKEEAEKLAWQNWSVSRNYQFLDGPPSYIPSLSSFNDGATSRLIRGVVAGPGNTFEMLRQTEARGSGKSRRVYKRTIVGVDIPDTQLQLIINSKINNDAGSGGNHQAYQNKQRLTLEGDFGTFFDVYMPDTTQSESLSMLTPDSMLYVLVEMADYDIEINGPKLFLYCYRHLTIAEAEVLMQKVPKLLEEMRLRKADTRQENVTNALVARTATDSNTMHRSLNKDVRWLTIAFFIFYAVGRVVDHPYARLALFVLVMLLLVKTAIDSVRESRLKRKYRQIISGLKQ
ncbi:MAG: hypothetical protein WAQ57_01140 [Candidatus Saccharimonadales bacterium]